jgi:hypothetical protein
MLRYAVLYADLEGVLYAVLIGSSTTLSINGFNMLFSPRNTAPFHSQYRESRPTARSQQKQQKNRVCPTFYTALCDDREHVPLTS